MSGVILIASILLWALGYFPRTTKETRHVLTTAMNENMIPTTTQTTGTITLKQGSSVRLTNVSGREQLKNSYIGKIGRFIEPAILPLGFNWKMGISLISGIAAKEVVVSTLGVLHNAEPDQRLNAEGLAMHLKSEVYQEGRLKGKSVFNPLATVSFLLFVLIYFPCIAVFAAVRKESGSIWWAFFMIIYTTLLAYIVSFIVYQAGTLLIT